MGSSRPPTHIERVHPISGLHFRDLWDICSHFQQVCSDFKHVSYTVHADCETVEIVKNETDVSKVLQELSEINEDQDIFSYRATFYRSIKEVQDDPQHYCEIVYCPKDYEEEKKGLTLRSNLLTKHNFYEFESVLYDGFDLENTIFKPTEFGKPCEMLCAVIDLRGFSTFCEQPQIESPYISELMAAFYHLVNDTFYKYPPDLIKFLGDGVLAVWETTYEDRDIAIDVCTKGVTAMQAKWEIVRQSPNFTHGAPTDVGIGVSFGLGSRLTVNNDYIGRPINLASRLCSVCPGKQIYVDKAVPALPDHYQKGHYMVTIKSFGKFAIWTLKANTDVTPAPFPHKKT